MDNITDAINKKTKNGKINCKDALEIAESLKVKPNVVGKQIDELKIKISSCQLGCFK